MSRVGKSPIIIPQGVDVNIAGQTVSIKGPKGELHQTMNARVRVAIKEEGGTKLVMVSVGENPDPIDRAQWGTARSIIQNLVTGVTEGFERKLEVNGVGYRVNMQGKNLVLNLGFSHEVPFQIPDGIEAVVEGNGITIKGADKQLVGEVAASIRKLRKPEPYKGKGIKYVEEVIRRKAGKSQKAGA